MRMSRSRWPFVVGVLVALGLAIWFLAPRIIATQAIAAIERSGRYEATLGSQSTSLTGGTSTLHDLRVVDKATGVTVFEAPRVDLRWNWSSVVHLAPHVSARVDHPTIRVPLGTDKAATAQQEVDVRAYLLSMRLFVVDRFEVTGGRASAYVARLHRTLTLTDVELLATGVTNRPAPRGQRPTDVTLRARLEGGLVVAHLTTDALAEPPACELHLAASDLPQTFAPRQVKLGVTTSGGTTHAELFTKLVDGHYDGHVRAGLSNVHLEAKQGSGRMEELRNLLAAGETKALGGIAGAGLSMQQSATFSGTLSRRDETLPAALREMLATAVKSLAPGDSGNKPKDGPHGRRDTRESGQRTDKASRRRDARDDQDMGSAAGSAPQLGPGRALLRPR